jgi:hypothetical protein
MMQFSVREKENDMKTQKQRAQESRDWNKWKPGGGRKAWSPFSQPEPIVRDDAGRPLKSDRTSIDVEKWVQEENEKHDQQ